MARICPLSAQPNWSQSQTYLKPMILDNGVLPSIEKQSFSQAGMLLATYYSWSTMSNLLMSRIDISVNRFTLIIFFLVGTMEVGDNLLLAA